MEMALLVLLFLVGTIGSAYQAMKYLERRNHRNIHSGTKRDGDGR